MPCQRLRCSNALIQKEQQTQLETFQNRCRAPHAGGNDAGRRPIGGRCPQRVRCHLSHGAGRQHGQGCGLGHQRQPRAQGERSAPRRATVQTLTKGTGLGQADVQLCPSGRVECDGQKWERNAPRSAVATRRRRVGRGGRNYPGRRQPVLRPSAPQKARFPEDYSRPAEYS